ncbi:MAG: TetR/AcrR family transcriptional regulator [Deltaproteobacteria bacterium]|nr:TetR/AcrR family transcriptional regulator [Deltaproteobacteria bacterium]MBW2137159.1 TetR/AcrR family transcriptional regulator [Deltaproteobacteria bacterium]
MAKRSLKERKADTIRRINEAAKEVFAEVGFEGARIDEIAKRAGVNKAMIYYRGGDKVSLYAGIIHEVFSETLGRIVKEVGEGKGPEDKLRTYIHNLSMTVEKHPYVPSIMLRELASGATNLPSIAQKDIVRLLGIITEIFEEGAKRGGFRRANPLIVHTMIVGGILLFSRLQSVSPKIGGLPKRTKELIGTDSKDVADRVTELVLRAVRRD